MTRNSAVRGTAVASLLFVGLIALAGCVPAVPAPVPTAVPTSTAAQPSATPTAAPPALVEGGTAKENQPYFDKVNLDYIKVNGMGFGRNIAQNLINAGFRKQDLEVTADRTSIDLQADSIILSVRLKGECLIGDFHAETYVSMVAPLLGTGGCLVGTTVPIP